MKFVVWRRIIFIIRDREKKHLDDKKNLPVIVGGHVRYLNNIHEYFRLGAEIVGRFARYVEPLKHANLST